jgi:UDP-N-acetylglucosamine 2-epimerase (non-hydrolysing)
VLRAIQHDDRLSSYLLSTGQHADLVDQALAPFGLTADATLPIDSTAGTLNELAALTLALLDRQLAALDPAPVMVQGDTLSATLGAMAAFWLHLPISHCEAGLRSGDLAAPFPGEANRKIIDHLSTFPPCTWLHPRQPRSICSGRAS